MTSALRCQDFLDRGDIDCAHLELMALHQSLIALESEPLDSTNDRELELLRSRAADLAARLDAKRAAAG